MKVTFTKEINRCYHECPYFELEGGPGPVMICGHPDAPEVPSGGWKGWGVISHPDCDNGFPQKCPLLLGKVD